MSKHAFSITERLVYRLGWRGWHAQSSKESHYLHTYSSVHGDKAGQNTGL
ncbi:hypothetical protein COCMIDRAFT_95153 [Bipolaris oryzae ATCC 44560]|uniref:Uncharacterized protein n=1 Tax=Bipolaris oryzae ATCC 44560 TaxID=930090 RepID=W6Z6G4_COCMI|nr:uncharacterized protein COCMIDRAFT_95153 [Bipolaris oryzae ATCC 44560]EUC45575.1 hypothetical protein COCMIDRAFT_95153 [Bipolaris oryzae ATCC 44560]